MHGLGDLSIGTLAQAYNGIIPRGGTWDVVPSRLWHYLTTNNSAHHDIMAQIGFDLLTSSCKRASLALADDVHIIVATIPRAVFIFSAVFTPCFFALSCPPWLLWRKRLEPCYWLLFSMRCKEQVIFPRQH